MNDEYINELKQRFPEIRRKKGVLREPETVRLLQEVWEPIDIRAAQLTDLLGYNIGRSQVIEDMAKRDPMLRAIKQERLEQTKDQEVKDRHEFQQQDSSDTSTAVH